MGLDNGPAASYKWSHNSAINGSLNVFFFCASPLQVELNIMN